MDLYIRKALIIRPIMGAMRAMSFYDGESGELFLLFTGIGNIRTQFPTYVNTGFLVAL